MFFFNKIIWVFSLENELSVGFLNMGFDVVFVIKSNLFFKGLYFKGYIKKV